jgi:hypothetical protein
MAAEAAAFEAAEGAALEAAAAAFEAARAAFEAAALAFEAAEAAALAFEAAALAAAVAAAAAGAGAGAAAAACHGEAAPSVEMGADRRADLSVRTAIPMHNESVVKWGRIIGGAPGCSRRVEVVVECVGGTFRARWGGALARVRKLRSLDWLGKGDVHLVDEVAGGDAVFSLEGCKPIFPRWSARLSVEADEYERLSLGGDLGLKSL